jgi:hypothetical protein
MSSRKTGSDNDFAIDTTGFAPAARCRRHAAHRLDLNAYTASTASPAVADERDRNDPGLRIALARRDHEPGLATNEATIDKARSTKVKAFVDAYNSIVDLTRTDIAEGRVKPRRRTCRRAAVRRPRPDRDALVAEEHADEPSTASAASKPRRHRHQRPEVDRRRHRRRQGRQADLRRDRTRRPLDKDWTQVQSCSTASAPARASPAGERLREGPTGLNGVLTGRMNSDSTSLKDLANQVTATNLRLTRPRHA